MALVQYTNVPPCASTPGAYGAAGLVMDYYDNTVTGLWNCAQHYAMSDNNHDTNFGPSTPGALNVVAGNDSPGYAVSPSTGKPAADPGTVSPLNGQGLGTIYGDLDPAYDGCSNPSHTSSRPVGVMTGRNIGNLLNARHITWGWFQGGFAPTGTNKAGYAVCGASHTNIAGNWLHGQRTGSGSFDQLAGSLDAPGGVLDFATRPRFRPLILDPASGEVVDRH